MNSLTDLSPLVEIEIPRCSSTIALYSLRRAIHETCMETSCWQEEITDNLVADQASYTLASASVSAIIYRIIDVNINSGDGSDLPVTEYEFTNNTTLTLDDAPTEATTDGLVVNVALINPVVGVDFTNVAILDRWGYIIADGAIARIAKMTAYRNDELAAQKAEDFRKGKLKIVTDITQTGFKTGQSLKVPIQQQFAKNSTSTGVNDGYF